VRGATTNHPARKQHDKNKNGRLTVRRGHHKKGPQEKDYKKGGVQCPAFFYSRKPDTIPPIARQSEQKIRTSSFPAKEIPA
jgi:hypothetical protein